MLKDGADKGSQVEAGTLYVVSTPIGNLRDITFRAVEVLQAVDVVAAEDTRHSRRLLDAYGIRTPLLSYHDHNKERRAPELLARLLNGQTVAVISDAGTPGISDPAFYLVRLCAQEGVPVRPVPGPTAFVAALVVSGLPTDRFVFEGFLPAKKGRRKRLEELSGEVRTIVLYESPHRLAKTLRDLHEALGDRKAVVVRELTKIHEEVLRGTLAELAQTAESRKLRGEMVIVVEGRTRRVAAENGV